MSDYIVEAKRGRGKRRPAAFVKRDQVALAEKIITEGKGATEAGAELGLHPRTAQRLAAQGLREMLAIPSNKLKLEEVFSVLIGGFTESLEDLQIIIDDYKRRGKNPPIKAILAKVTTLLAAAKTCGLGNDRTIIQTSAQHYAPVAINFTVVGRDGNKRAVDLSEYSTRRPALELPAAPDQSCDVTTLNLPCSGCDDQVELDKCREVSTLKPEVAPDQTHDVRSFEPDGGERR